MDIRNIQKTGGQSYVVTLPKEWVTSNSMKEKAKVKIFNHKHYLNIVPFIQKKCYKYPICFIDSMSKHQIYREIIGYYLSGTENIVVKSNTLTYEQRAAVRQISYRLIGCECLESTTNQMLLRNISNNVHLLMPEYIKKMISMIISMYRDTLQYLESGDRKMALDIIERDVEIDRLHLAITRSHNIRLNEIETEEANSLSLLDSHFYELTAIRLERIGDHIVRVGTYFALKDKKYRISYTSSEKVLIKNTLYNLLFCKEMLSSLEKKKAHKFLDIFKDILESNTTKKYTNNDNFNLVVTESNSRIHHYIANIAEEIINYTNTKLALAA